MTIEEHIQDLLNESDSRQQGQIRADLESFIQHVDPDEAKRAVKYVEKLSKEIDSAERKDIREDFANLLDYSVPPRDISTSVRRKYSQGRSTRQNKSSSYSNSSSSDYHLQKHGDYPENWDTLRKQAYKRDNYECQNCGVGGGSKGEVELHAHHIVPVSAGGNHTLSNLSTLCDTCHGLIHDHLD